MLKGLIMGLVAMLISLIKSKNQENSDNKTPSAEEPVIGFKSKEEAEFIHNAIANGASFDEAREKYERSHSASDAVSRSVGTATGSGVNLGVHTPERDSTIAMHPLQNWQKSNGGAAADFTESYKEPSVPLDTTRSNQRKDTSPMVTSPEPDQEELSAPHSVSTGRFETLFESEPMMIQGSIPVLIEHIGLLKSCNQDSLITRCTFQNLSDKQILAMLIDVAYADIWGTPTAPVEGVQFLDLRVERGERFGETIDIPVPDKATRWADVSIRKVVLGDRSIIEDDGVRHELPKQVPLIEYFGSKELADEYIRETTVSARFAPVVGTTHWRCTCGAINTAADTSCYRCGEDLAKACDLLNADAIGAHLAERQEKERLKIEAELAERAERAEQRRQEEERQRREREAFRTKRKKMIKRIAIPAAALLIIATAVYALISYVIIPGGKYNKAKEALTAGDYDVAYADFTALGDYRDSGMWASHAIYSKAVDLMYSGDYLEAISVFDMIGDYKNSQELADYCRKQTVNGWSIELIAFNDTRTDDTNIYSSVSLISSRNYLHFGFRLQGPPNESIELSQCCIWPNTKRETHDWGSHQSGEVLWFEWENRKMSVGKPGRLTVEIRNAESNEMIGSFHIYLNIRNDD